MIENKKSSSHCNSRFSRVRSSIRLHVHGLWKLKLSDLHPTRHSIRLAITRLLITARDEQACWRILKIPVLCAAFFVLICANSLCIGFIGRYGILAIASMFIVSSPVEYLLIKEAIREARMLPMREGVEKTTEEMEKARLEYVEKIEKQRRKTKPI